jgi:hypothetical protein
MKKGKKDQTPLLTEKSPVLSDEMPSPEKDSAAPLQRKGSLRRLGFGKRLFRGKNKNKLSQDQEQAIPMTKSSYSLEDENSIPTESPTRVEESQHRNTIVEQTKTTTTPQSILRKPQTAAAAAETQLNSSSPLAGPGVVQAPQKEVEPKLTKAELKVKNLLGRPFGRENIDPTRQSVSTCRNLWPKEFLLAAKSLISLFAILLIFTTLQWLVQVATAEWETEEKLWKYRIVVQKKVGKKLQDYTNGLTFRSLSDFSWLEKALRTEFHGALLLPNLAISLGVPDMEHIQHEVDAKLLAEWLSDVLNAVRGRGKQD